MYNDFLILDINFNSFLHIMWFFASISFIKQMFSKPFLCIRHCDTLGSGEVNKMNKTPG